MNKLACLLSFACCCIQLACSQEFQPSAYVSKHDTLPFQILYPKHFQENSATQYPLVFFLHGAGERGNDNKAQLKWGAPLFTADSNYRKFPAVVVFPQCPKDSYWSNVKSDRAAEPDIRDFQEGGSPTVAMQLALGLFDSLTQLPFIDTQRVYVAGLSMGGMGTLELLRRRPGKIAAAVAICGGDAVANTVHYQQLPLWLFHGKKDDVVPVTYSRQLVVALWEADSPVRYTEYPEANHLSWIPAFRERELLPWLFAQRKK